MKTFHFETYWSINKIIEKQKKFIKYVLKNMRAHFLTLEIKTG